MEAQYIKENKSKASNALDEHSTGSSATTPSTKREFKKRRALLVWPVAGNSPPNIIYLNSKIRDRKRIDILNLSTSYHDWVLLNTSYRKNSYYKYYLFDLDGNQWIEGPEYDNCLSPACIQFASYSQCQFIIWTMISNSKKSTTDSTTTDTPNLHAVDNGNQATRIQWEVFDAQKGQSQCQKILSDQITIPYCPDGVIEALTYTEKMCLIIIFDKENHLKRFVGGKFSATLSLFVLGKFSLNASAQSIFDARDYGRVLPIDSADQGRILWSRLINGDRITNLYSEKLIVVRNEEIFDVLNAHDGSLLRSIACPYYSTLTPFLGLLCGLSDSARRKNWFIDMRTGRIYDPPTRLISRQTEDVKKYKPLRLSDTAHLLLSNEGSVWKASEYTVSNVAIGRVDENDRRVYKAYMF
ncbi:hypothetical protein BDF19DRAFT_55744 [Syncephalis fuscata]|nr:hypothetical protein BDF19DRAFT_55744 [Syncephalis fuscata]